MALKLINIDQFKMVRRAARFGIPVFLLKRRQLL